MPIVKKRSTLQIWGDVIFALLIREARSKFNDKFGLSWAVLDPLIFILMLSFVRGLMSGGEVHGMPIFIFMTFGMILLRAFTDSLTAASMAIKRNKALYAFRQVQPISGVVAAAIFSMIIDILVFFLVLLFMLMAKIEIRLDDLLTIIVVYFQVFFLGLSIGILFGIGAAFVKEVEKIRTLCTRPLMFISGVFFSLQDMPSEFWPYLDWNPLLHGIELSRQAAYSDFGAVGIDHGYLSILTLIFLFLAVACYHLTWKDVLSR